MVTPGGEQERSGGLIEPAHVRISLPRRLRKTRFVLGTVNHVDSQQKVVSWEGPEDTAGQVRYDRLILTAGRVNKLLPIPGIADYAHGFRTIAEAGYLHDHIIRQLELASVAADPCRSPRRPADGRPGPRYQPGAAGGR